MTRPFEPAPKGRNPILFVGEGYKDAVNRLHGEKRAVERDLAAAQPQLSAGLRAAQAWRAGPLRPMLREDYWELAEALDALAAVVPGEGE